MTPIPKDSNNVNIPGSFPEALMSAPFRHPLMPKGLGTGNITGFCELITYVSAQGKEPWEAIHWASPENRFMVERRKILKAHLAQGNTCAVELVHYPEHSPDHRVLDLVILRPTHPQQLFLYSLSDRGQHPEILLARNTLAKSLRIVWRRTVRDRECLVHKGILEEDHVCLEYTMDYL